MGLFDFLKRKESITNADLSKAAQIEISPGHASAERVELEYSVFEQMKKSFIAFDVETTGLNPSIDRIVELGAVLFVDGRKVNRSISQMFGTKSTVCSCREKKLSLLSKRFVTNWFLPTSALSRLTFRDLPERESPTVPCRIPKSSSFRFRRRVLPNLFRIPSCS